eukprot:TRINITY_DN129_c0_g3_i1.p1 TRINITY_DN129_c0_g3~~TRINITY_DN129_c0_g3_i1.p1  ORF type:complete len:327 (+),score=63.49 TRINITY_DN129_c0_g3_i1:45-1025(+)
MKKTNSKLPPPKKVKLEDFEIMATLGTGSFGRVRLAKEKRNKKYWAIKILKKAEIIRLKQVDHIISECCLLDSIKHPFIVNMEGVAHDDRYLYMVLEFVRGGELFTYLRAVTSFPVPQAQFFASQIVLIFEYLHSKNIIYRDLKPENLLIDEEGYLKLTDFGFAKICDGRTYTLCGTPEYLAPEMLLNKGHGKPVDWWTFGILLYEMLAGIDPFSDEDPMNIYQKILKGKVQFPKDFDKNAKSLVRHILQADLSKRYGNLKGGATDIKNHRFFKSTEWDNILNRKVRPEYMPPLKGMDDTRHFSKYPDSETKSPIVKRGDDPFADW